MKMNLLNCLVVLMLLFFVPCNFAAGYSSKKVEDYLNFLNKTPLKSIQSPDGDIIDCIHISHQPAFDHPLLQNHTIQLRPPEGLFEHKSIDSSKSNEGVEPIKQVWHLNGECPDGTIPVRRIKKEDVLRAGSIKNYGRKKNILGLNDLNLKAHQHSFAYVHGDKYFGTKASINVWEPTVQQPDEFSLAQIWVIGGALAGDDGNTIEAGWQVYQKLYGDTKARLFTYWTRDSYQSTGCYNLVCSGFVQTSKDLALGAAISPISSYGGPQFDITIQIRKDPSNGDWWMQFGNTADQVIGYWPANLFTAFADGAHTIEWGGEILNFESDGQHTTTQMGSGHFPGEGYGKASYFRNIQLIDGSNQLRVAKEAESIAERSNCYDIEIRHNEKWDTFFYFGGPGRNPNCP